MFHGDHLSDPQTHNQIIYFAINHGNKIPWATTTTPQLLTMKECSREEVLKGKKSQYDPPTHPGHQLDQVDSEIKNMG